MCINSNNNNASLMPSSLHFRCSYTIKGLIATTCLVILLAAHYSQAASVNRVNMHQVSKQTNQCEYFLS